MEYYDNDKLDAFLTKQQALRNYSPEELIYHLMARLNGPKQPAPRHRTWGVKAYSCIIGIGNDNVAYLEMAEEDWEALKNLFDLGE